MSRTALLIRCAATEAERIREKAEQQQNTISAYILRVVLRAVEAEDLVCATTTPYTGSRIVTQRATIESGPRTALLLRCDVSQADRIREAARRRAIPINRLVLQSLKNSWEAQVVPPLPSAESSPQTFQASTTA